MNIATALRTDATDLVKCYNAHLGTATLDTTPRQADFFVEMMDKLEHRETLLTARVDVALAGYAILKKYSWKQGYYHAGEISIFLENQFTGKGIGQRLMRELFRLATEWEYRQLVARIMARNQGSISFHKKLGYEMVGVQKRIGFANGEWQDVAIMQLDLERVL